MRLQGIIRAALVAFGLALTGCAGSTPGSDHSLFSFGAVAGRDTESPAPSDLDAPLKLAQAQRKNGDFTGATRTLGQLVLAAPDDPRVLGEYGKTLAAEGRADDALAFLSRAIELQPDDWTLFSAQGVAYAQKGNNTAAQAAFARALELKPNEPSVLSNDAMSHLQAGDLDGAERLLVQAEQSGASDPRIADNLALVRSLKPSGMPATAAVPAAAPDTKTADAAATSAAPAAATVPVPEMAQTVLPPAPDAAAPLKPSQDMPVPGEQTRASVQMTAAHSRSARTEFPPIPRPRPQPPIVQASVELPAGSAPAAAESAVPSVNLIGAHDPSSPAIYVQAGAFSSVASARRLANKLRRFGAHVSSAREHGHAIYLVRIGPFPSVHNAVAMLAQLQALGHHDVNIVTD